MSADAPTEFLVRPWGAHVALVVTPDSVHDVAEHLNDHMGIEAWAVTKDEGSVSFSVPYVRYRDGDYGYVAEAGDIVVLDGEGATIYSSMADLAEDYEVVTPDADVPGQPRASS